MRYIEDIIVEIQGKITVQANDAQQIRIKEDIFGDLSLRTYKQAKRLLKEAWEIISLLPADAPLPPFEQLVDYNIM